MTNPYDQYRKVSLTTATPGRLIVMLYDRAIQDLEGAVEAIQANQPAIQGERIIHAQDIISELLGALDMEAGGGVAASLRNLYLYMIRRLIGANRERNVQILEEVAGLLQELREGWDAATKPAREAVSAPGPMETVERMA